MSLTKTSKSHSFGAVALAAMFGASAVAIAIPAVFAPGVAVAQTADGHTGTGGKGPQYKGGTGTGGTTGEHGTAESGKGPMAGKGGEESDSEGVGPQHGQPSSSSGGKPAWSQEGVPSDVELGRLSVLRSPDKVLARALAEVVANWDGSLAALYNLPAEEFGDYIRVNWDTITIIDSPLENLALFDALLKSADHNTVPLTGVDSNLVELASIFIGVASDKTIPVTTDTVKALLTIAGYTLPADIVQSIADKAELVRLDVLAGHG